MRSSLLISAPLTVDLPAIKAVSIGSTATRLINREGLIGKVDGVFERTVNILTEKEELFSLAGKDITRSPITINLDIPLKVGMFTFGIKPGASIIRSGQSMRISQSSLRVSLDRAVLWKARRRIEASLPIKDIRRNCNTAKDIATDYGKQGGLSALAEYLNTLLEGERVDIKEFNPYLRMAFPHIVTVVKAVLSQNLYNLGISVRGLVGLGPGLTPSCDDMLMGFMSSLLLATEALGGDLHYAREVNQAIIHFGNGQTTLLSQKLLEHAARGETSEVTRDMIEAIATGTDEQVKKTASDLLSVGHYSGTDNLLGILIGFNVAMNIA